MTCFDGSQNSRQNTSIKNKPQPHPKFKISKFCRCFHTELLRKPEFDRLGEKTSWRLLTTAWWLRPRQRLRPRLLRLNDGGHYDVGDGDDCGGHGHDCGHGHGQTSFDLRGRGTITTTNNFSGGTPTPTDTPYTGTGVEKTLNIMLREQTLKSNRKSIANQWTMELQDAMGKH